MLGLPVWLPALTSEATVLGAVVAGGVGVGLFNDFNVIDRIISLRAAELPEPACHQHYAALLDLFQQTYKALNPIFAKLAGLAAVEPRMEK